MQRSACALAAFVVVCAAPVSRAQTAAQIPDQYRAAAQRIVTAALLGNHAHARLVELCDGIGNRLSGSAALTRAVAWSAATMKAEGLENVHTEKVMVPVWIRGHGRVSITAPRAVDLPCLALGGSVGTPAGGLDAEVVVVKSFPELDALPLERVKGRVVVFNVPYEGYGKTVQYRRSGASRAARKGAVAVLVRSAGFGGVRTPHTGAMEYEPDAPQVPAVAVSAEDAALLGRLSATGGPVRVHIDLGCRTEPDAESANIIGELVGRERPDEVVVLGGHIDSWDVGAGAMDDGGGVVTAMEAVALLKRLGLKPQRTIRVVFWTNEENGLRGAEAYRDAHRAELAKHVAAIETDGGVEKPVGFGFPERLPRGGSASRPAGGTSAAAAAESRPTAAVAAASRPDFARLQAVLTLLAGIECSDLVPDGGGADIGPLMRLGVPGLEMRTVGTRYFEWHHTEGDTVDKIDPALLDRHVAALAVVAFVLADMEERL